MEQQFQKIIVKIDKIKNSTKMPSSVFYYFSEPEYACSF